MLPRNNLDRITSMFRKVAGYALLLGILNIYNNNNNNGYF